VRRVKVGPRLPPILQGLAEVRCNLRCKFPSPLFPSRKTWVLRILCCPLQLAWPVSITGVIPEEPVVTQAVAAGSGVLCGFLPEPSGTCCAAFCAALRTGSAACHHVLNVMLPGLGVMGRSHLRRLSQLIGNHVGRIFLHPIGRTRRPKILQEPQP